MELVVEATSRSAASRTPCGSGLAGQRGSVSTRPPTKRNGLTAFDAEGYAQDTVRPNRCAKWAVGLLAIAAIRVSACSSRSAPEVEHFVACPVSPGSVFCTLLWYTA